MAVLVAEGEDQARHEADKRLAVLGVLPWTVPRAMASAALICP